MSDERRFLFRLAQSLGKTVEELETGHPAPLSHDELAEWEAFHYFEPWGAPAEDDRWRLHYLLQWKGHGFVGDAPDWITLDRDPEETARLKAEAEASISSAEKLISFFSPRAVRKKPKDTPET